MVFFLSYRFSERPKWDMVMHYTATACMLQMYAHIVTSKAPPTPRILSVTPCVRQGHVFLKVRRNVGFKAVQLNHWCGSSTMTGPRRPYKSKS